MKKIIQKTALRWRRSYLKRRYHGMISLKPKNKKIQGSVLISYVVGDFLKNPQDIPCHHTNCWEMYQIAKTFLEKGYCVDAIGFKNTDFSPKKRYDIFICIGRNFERLIPLLNEDCVKILHATGAHWIFQYHAEYNRIVALHKRRGITLTPKRVAKLFCGHKHADYITMIGNDFTEGTYSFLGKEIYRLPVPAVFTRKWDDTKDYDRCRKNFIWLGSVGMVHKGLDLVIEAFVQMPHCTLTVCGTMEQDFAEAYHKELYQTHNIKTVGWVEMGSDTFFDIASRSLGIVYPSCSEGMAGSVVNCMQAGLIPLISYESGVDVGDFGLVFKTSTVEDIKVGVETIAKLPSEELAQRSKKTVEYSQQHYSRKAFTRRYRDFVDMIIPT